ncbi:HK97-gp10 family putative phage morphogenesis protein [Lactiplantibacillus paraxiangfangensis]|uniref:HK97-gp10 family putative phage morphogenesis protein n=1 Tax=Lactiplantibacillus paraxiangfangensis TaxID=3076224 RepID=UPI0030C728D4
MAIRATVKWSGVDDLVNQLDLSQANADKYGKEAMKGVVAKAQRTAKSLARYRTGFMRNNINPKPVTGSGKAIVGTLISEAEYSSFNEYGTFKMSSKPFMRPAVSAATPFFYQSFEEALRKAGEIK